MMLKNVLFQDNYYGKLKKKRAKPCYLYDNRALLLSLKSIEITPNFMN